MPATSAKALSPAPAAMLRTIASLKATLVLLAVLGVVIVQAYRLDFWRDWPLALSLSALAVNLLAAIATNAAFRRQAPLLVFHLSLVALLLLVAAGRLSYLKGTLELTEGANFEGELTTVDAAPFHQGRLDQVRFVNRGFAIDYAPGLQRGPTRNAVEWLDQTGQWQRAIIGDQEPLRVYGYRFYTSFNKGFAPYFRWLPHQGEPLTGAVHLPSYPLNEFSQARDWQLPGTSRELWVMLQFDEVIIDPAQPSAFRLPRDYRLVVRSGDERWEMRPGQSLGFPEGTLRFEGLRTWMGYNVFYDWTLPWLAAASLVAILSLGWHFWRKFAAKPWDA